MKKPLPFHCEMSKSKKARARRALRREIKASPDFNKDDLEADVIIEQVWNALAGHSRLKHPGIRDDVY